MKKKENIEFIYRLDNKSRSTNFFILYITSGIVFLGLAFLFIATDKNYELIANIILAVGYFILLHRIKPSFFEMLVTAVSMQVNFYSVSSAVRHYQSIEIPLSQLRDFEIRTSFLGMKKELILTVQMQYGLADYPPVSVSILSKNELEQVEFIMNKILTSNLSRKK